MRLLLLAVVMTCIASWAVAGVNATGHRLQLRPVASTGWAAQPSGARVLASIDTYAPATLTAGNGSRLTAVILPSALQTDSAADHWTLYE